MTTSNATVLFVRGFHPDTRQRELADEFEKMGDLIRCELPPPKSSSSGPFAFVEYRDPRDAKDAFDRLHNKPVCGGSLIIEWARVPHPNRRSGGGSFGDRYRDRDYDDRRRDDYSRYRDRDYDDRRRDDYGRYRNRDIDYRRDSYSRRRDDYDDDRRRPMSDRSNSISPRRDRSVSPRRGRSASYRRDRSISSERSASVSPKRGSARPPHTSDADKLDIKRDAKDDDVTPVKPAPPVADTAAAAVISPVDTPAAATTPIDAPLSETDPVAPATSPKRLPSPAKSPNKSRPNDD